MNDSNLVIPGQVPAPQPNLQVGVKDGTVWLTIHMPMAPEVAMAIAHGLVSAAQKAVEFRSTVQAVIQGNGSGVQ